MKVLEGWAVRNSYERDSEFTAKLEQATFHFKRYTASTFIQHCIYGPMEEQPGDS
jgi:hypothetical protein